MARSGKRPGRPGLVVLRKSGERRWELLGEVDRRGGLTAREARTAAVVAVTRGKARPGEVYAAVLRSEWRLSLDWEPRARRRGP